MSRTTFRSEVLGEEPSEESPRPLLSRERRPAASRPVGEGSAIQDESVTSLPLFLVSFRRCVIQSAAKNPGSGCARNGRQFSESGEKQRSDTEVFAKTFHVKRSKVQENKTRIFWMASSRLALYPLAPVRERIEGEGPMAARLPRAIQDSASGLLDRAYCLRVIPTEAEGPRLRNSSADELPRPFVGRDGASGADEGPLRRDRLVRCIVRT